MSSLLTTIKSLAEQTTQSVIAHRNHIHAHPELSFEEHNTHNYIATALESEGIACKKNVADTGVIATIEGKNPSKKTIALRADIDALPILEANHDKSYRSKNDGIMHACGHDVHTSSLLGTTKILHQIRDQFEGTVRCLFQPGEEKLPGGASLMIKAGALQNPTPNSIFGQHVHPPLEAGKVGFRPGMMMASADEIMITIKGKGGHGAMPRDFIDPVLMASHVMIALQQIVSRNADPLIPTVLSFGKFQAGAAPNVIPDEVHLHGTLRTFNEVWRKEAHEKIKTLVLHTCKAMGGDADVNILVGYPFLNNDETLTLNAKQWAIDFLGEENVVDLPMRCTAEDFSYYSQHVPACFYRLGTGNKAKGITSMVHTATFDIDEKALAIGPGLMAWLTVNQLNLS